LIQPLLLRACPCVCTIGAAIPSSDVICDKIRILMVFMNRAEFVTLKFEVFATPVPYWMTWHIAVNTEATSGKVHGTFNEAMVGLVTECDEYRV